jgi:hypothetical protein
MEYTTRQNNHMLKCNCQSNKNKPTNPNLAPQKNRGTMFTPVRISKSQELDLNGKNK